MTTNREVYIECEETVSKYYPDYTDCPELREDIIRLVDIVMFELGIPKGMAISYVRNVFSSYNPKIKSEEIIEEAYREPMIGEVRYRNE